MLKARLIYSACLEVAINDIKILTDPWLIHGAYYGAWNLDITGEPLHEISSDIDFVIVTHIHPDHCCIKTLRVIKDFNPAVKIIIPDWNPRTNYLGIKLRSEGFDNVLIENDFRLSDRFAIYQFPLVRNSASDIDSYHIIVDPFTRNALVNLNDCFVDDILITQLNSFIRQHKLKVILTATSYAGAGPYPQCFFGLEEQQELLISEAVRKKKLFLKRYKHACEKIDSQYFLPFAGKYKLSTSLSSLNTYRGIASPEEACAVHPKSINLCELSQIFDFDSGQVESYDHQYVESRSSPSHQYQPNKFVVETLLTDSYLKRLVMLSSYKAHAKSECPADHFILFYVVDGGLENLVNLAKIEDPTSFSTFITSINCNRFSGPGNVDCAPVTENRLFITRSYLYYALSGVMHWNNLRTGSLFLQRRIPNAYEKTVDTYINFLSIL